MSHSRRRFLQTTIAGSAGLVVAPSFFPESFLHGQGASPSRRIQIAQIGCEYQLLDDAVHPDAKMAVKGNRTLAGVYDRIPPVGVRSNPIGVADNSPHLSRVRQS